MLKKALFCKACDAQLSNWLKEICTVEDMYDLCSFEGSEPINPIPAGYVLNVSGLVLKERQKNGWNPENKPEHWMALGDVLGHVKYTNIPVRLSGCCGPSGIDGPNRLCECGAEIGTESSDCWTYHMFTVHDKTTYWKLQ